MRAHLHGGGTVIVIDVAQFPHQPLIVRHAGKLYAAADPSGLPIVPNWGGIPKFGGIGQFVDYYAADVVDVDQ